MNEEKIITPEEMVHMSIDQLTEMYRQGYELDSLPIRRRARIPPRRRGVFSSSIGSMDIDNMVCIDERQITGTDVMLSIVGIMVGALVYYKLGKWESKKLGWD